MIFSSPTILWEACCEYFEVTSQRRWMQVEFNGKDALRCEVPNEIPFTLTGMYIFLDISHQTWVDYRERKDFIEVITRVENIIYTQKFEGAAIGAFHANIIARDLGLTDKRDLQANVRVEDITGMEIK